MYVVRCYWGEGRALKVLRKIGLEVYFWGDDGDWKMKY